MLQGGWTKRPKERVVFWYSHGGNFVHSLKVDHFFRLCHGVVSRVSKPELSLSKSGTGSHDGGGGKASSFR